MGSGGGTMTMHWDGEAWSLVPSPNTGYDNYLMDIAVLSDRDVWAVGYSTSQPNILRSIVMRWNGSSWGLVQDAHLGSGTRLYGVAAVSPSDIWAVGSLGDTGPTFIEHWDGSQWTAVTHSGAYGVLSGVAAVSSADIWAVGDYSGNPARTLVFHAASPCPPGTPTNTPTYTPTSGPTTPSPDTPSPTITPTGTPWTTPSPASTGSSTPTRTWTPPHASSPTAALTRTSIPTAATSATPCVMSFSDVALTDYFYEPVRYLYCRGIISGYEDGTFRPYNNTTRSQTVKIVVLGFGIPLSTRAIPTFADVPTSNPFFTFVETAAERGIVSGYACGGQGEPCDDQNRSYFRPYNLVTRGQLSKIVVVAAEWELINPADSSFSDVPPSHAFYTFVETAYHQQVISGYADGTFRPGSSATRGQIAKIVYLAVTQ